MKTSASIVGARKVPMFLYGLPIVRRAVFTNLRSSVALCAEGFKRFHHTALIHRVDITLFVEYQTYGANFVTNLTKSPGT